MIASRHTKPERYVLNRYLNTEKKLSIQKVAGEIAHYYWMPKNVAIPMIRKIRARAALQQSTGGMREKGLPNRNPHKCYRGWNPGGRSGGTASISVASEKCDNARSSNFIMKFPAKKEAIGLHSKTCSFPPHKA
ncbi:MAG TPA: hypothetical protein DCP92_15895 [Nitrospiraceae bacterium]|nr:hypothetical protein [Nitrospiraceae bacterium]